MTLEITFKDGRWLVNSKRLIDLNHDEKMFMDDFFREMKATYDLYDSGNRTYSRVRPSGAPGAQEIQQSQII